jgi:hypothetical protein
MAGSAKAVANAVRRQVPEDPAVQPQASHDRHSMNIHRPPRFGPVVFSGSRFVFWSLGPCSLLFAFGIALVAYSEFRGGRSLTSGIAAAAALVSVCFFLALWDGTRFWWAGRVVTATVFCAYLYYALDMWLIRPMPVGIAAPPGRATPWRAILGLLIIGWPCFCYTFFGRFTLRAPPPPDMSPSDLQEELESDSQDTNDDHRNI